MPKRIAQQKPMRQSLALLSLIILASCQALPQKGQSADQVSPQNQQNKAKAVWPYPQTTGPQQEKKETGILVTGDLMLDWGVKEVMEQNSPSYPGRYIKPLTERYHITVANLETPIARDCKFTQNKLYTFRGEPEHLQLLTYLNIRAVSLANNHIGDCGRQGMRATMRHLRDHSIAYGGLGPHGPLKERQHIHSNVNGNKVTILAYGQKTLEQDRATPDSLGAYYPKADIVEQETKYWRRHSDILIASVHWGTEYYDRPLGRQKKLARRLIDWGADAVIGHHSHWFQGIETYKDGVIIYSLGNFIFGSNSPYLRNGYIAGLIFAGYQLKRVEIYPIHTKNTLRHRFQPMPLRGDQAQWVLRHTGKLSRELGSQIHLRDDNYAVVPISHKTNPYKPNNHLRQKLQKLANQ